MNTKYMTTQQMRNRAAQEAAERQGRMLGLILGVEVFGFAAMILIELFK